MMTYTVYYPDSSFHFHCTEHTLTKRARTPRWNEIEAYAIPESGNGQKVMRLTTNGWVYEEMTTITAPPDLAQLIEAHRAADTTAARLAAHYQLLRWPGWRKRVVYTHGPVRIARIWGSLKMDEITPLGVNEHACGTERGR